MRCTFQVVLIRQPVPNELSLVKVCVRVIFHRLKIGKELFDAVCYSNHLDVVLAETFAQGLNLQVAAILFLVSDAVDEVF